MSTPTGYPHHQGLLLLRLQMLFIRQLGSVLLQLGNVTYIVDVGGSRRFRLKRGKRAPILGGLWGLVGSFLFFILKRFRPRGCGCAVPYLLIGLF